MRTVICSVAFTLICASGADAYSGIELLRGCKQVLSDKTPSTTGDAIGAVFCTGYLSGLMDAAAFAGDIPGNTRLFCLPSAGLANEQAIRIVVKHLEQNPEGLHESARVNAIIALKRSFPCGD